MEKILEELVAEFHKEEIPTLFTRELKVPTDISKIVTIIGIRRCGKTYFLYQTINKYLKKLKKREIFYLNFEDERIENLRAEDLSKLIEIYYKFNPSAKNVYLFLDEIQNIKGWEKFLRRLSEKKNYRIFITGSSSKLLSKEIATSLRGRTLSYNLFTLSFNEFLCGKNFKYKKPLIEKEKGKIKHYLEEYLEYGGFPEIINLDINLKIKTLKEYFDLIVYKDLVDRYKIKNIKAMKLLIRSLILSFSSFVSLRKIHNFLLQETPISKNRVYEYFSHLEDIGFLYTTKKFGYGLREVEASIPKIYIVDLGFITLQGIKELGRRIENLVGIELMKRKSYFKPLLEVYYWKDTYGREVDFVLKEGLHVKQLIQVCYDVDEYATKEREVKSLLKASKELKCNNLLIITWDYEGEEEHKGKKIKFIPLWKWLLFY